MQAKGEQKNTCYFGLEPHEIGIDNICSACISNEVNDFIGILKETDIQIKGFGGMMDVNIKKGTLKWKISYNKGKVHTFIIPKSFYAPNGGVRLLRPQHWARSIRHQTGCRAESNTTDKK